LTPFLRGFALLIWFFGTVCGLTGYLAGGCWLLFVASSVMIAANVLEAEYPA
jgi:hypothetical protein